MNTQSDSASDYNVLASYTSKKTHPFGWLSNLSKVLVKLFAAREESALKVWQSHDQGQPRWHIYDSTTGQYVYLDSEAAARSWIEQRYYIRESYQQKPYMPIQSGR